MKRRVNNGAKPIKQKIILKQFGFDGVSDFSGPGSFGAGTRDVNALRARSLWLQASVRLLDDLIEVTKDAVKGLAGDYDLVLRACLASPALFRSIQFTNRQDLRGVPNFRAVAQGEKSVAHRVWVTQRDNLGAPLEALTHLLAQSITEQFQEPTAVVTFVGAQLSVQWRYPGRTVAAQPPVSQDIAYISGLTDPPFCHLLFVAPDGRSPKSILGKLYGGFHRVVYLAETLPREMPSHFFGLLYPAVRRRAVGFSRSAPGHAHIHWSSQDEGPFFSSFVTSLTRKPTSEAFATEAVDDEFEMDDPAPPGKRIDRDHCRIWFNMESIQDAWSNAPNGRGKANPFVKKLLKETDTKETAFRWARAVTNRSVGIALSGGGASSYALVPLLRDLHKLNVPVDVLSGVSGGAFLGAYYCKEGLDGLEHCINDGWLYQLGILPDAVVSEVGRWIVDSSLGGTGVGETKVRFVPVTIALRGDKPPCAQRIRSGTLGEAVQASGAAPLLFGPVYKRNAGRWTRYSDGGMAMLIPARILRNHGADLLFAFNCLSGPAQSNPLVRMPGGRLLYSWTPIGRVIDLWMSGAYMQERLSRAVNPDVSVYFEAPPETAPSLKSFFFASAKDIAQQSDLDPKTKAKAQECSDTWERFAKTPPVLVRLARRKRRPKRKRR